MLFRSTVRNVHDNRWGERPQRGQPTRTIDFVFNTGNIEPLDHVPAQPIEQALAERVRLSDSDRALLAELEAPVQSPDASSSGKGLGDMGNPVFYRGADSADPLDMQLPTRPGADQAVFFTNSQEEAGKFGSNIHHYHIPELDNLADVRWSNYLVLS